MPNPNRIAYRDEYPWIRCSCGQILGMNSLTPCVGCGDATAEVDFRDRFAREETKDLEGNTYRPVPYEDMFRRSF